MASRTSATAPADARLGCWGATRAALTRNRASTDKGRSRQRSMETSFESDAASHEMKTPPDGEVAAGLTVRKMGLGRVELPTSRLSGVRSNHLSYRPYWRRLDAKTSRRGITPTPASAPSS